MKIFIIFKQIFFFCFIILFNNIFGQNNFNGVSPLNNSITLAPDIKFEWDSLSEASDYLIEIASDVNFTDLVYSQNNITTCNIQPTITSGYGKYYWRIMANLINSGQLTTNTDSFIYFNPNSLNSLSLWLSGDSVQANGTNIEKWLDKSPNNFNPYQFTTTRQPNLISSVSQLNNLPVVQFNGSNVLTLGDSIDINTDDITIFLIGKSNNTSGVYLGKDKVGDHNNSYALWYVSDRLRFKYSDGTSKQIYRGLGHGDYEMISVTSDRVNQNLSFFTNGNNQGTSPAILDTTYNFNSSHPFNIGSSINNSSFTEFLNGQIAEILIYSNHLNDSTRRIVEKYLHNKYSPIVNLGQNIYIPYGFCNTRLYCNHWFQSYLWNTTETTDTITVNSSGTYYVTVNDIFDFNSSDTIEVFYPKIFASPPNDTTLCLGDTLKLTSQLNTTGYSFSWQNNAVDSFFSITEPGQYWVTVTDTFGCSLTSDTLNVSVDSLPSQTSLGPDKTVCRGANIGLTSGNSPGLDYLWNTGDTSPQITIDSAGTYTIAVTNSNNCVGKDTIIIDTSGIAPDVNFTIENLCTNTQTLFTNTSTTQDGSNIVSEFWSFGDGDTTSLQNPGHQFTSNINYTVNLQIETDSGCVNSFDSTIQIHNPPTAGFFVTNSILICSESNTYFTDNSFSTDGTVDSWLWNFGDTGTIDTSSLQHPSYVFPITNIYNVELIVTSQYGCSDTITQAVTVKQSPVASFTTSNLCEASNTEFNSTTQGNIFAYNWDFGDFNTSTLNNPINTYATAGSYTVRLAATEVNGCSDTIYTAISISENPVAHFNPQDFCIGTSGQIYDSSTTNSGNITNWNWNMVNHPYQNNDQNPDFLFTAADTGGYYLDLIVTTDLGCTDSIRDSINVFPLPIAEFTFTPTTGAPPVTVYFTNQTSGASTYLWDFGDSSNSSLISPDHFYQDSSSYLIQLIATSTFGCVDSIQKSILIIDPITDIAVSSISYSFINNSKFLTIAALLTNLGTFPINTSDIEVEVSGKGTILEKWTGTINTGSSVNYSLTSSFDVNSEIPDLICVRALSPNNLTDVNSDNNEFCIALNKFELISISPNPTANYINLNYIVPNNGEGAVHLYNSSGKKVKTLFSGSLEKGLIRQSFNLATYSNGMYVIEIKFQESAIREKILIK